MCGYSLIYPLASDELAIKSRYCDLEMRAPKEGLSDWSYTAWPSDSSLLSESMVSSLSLPSILEDIWDPLGSVKLVN
jgi:hypothetical protein